MAKTVNIFILHIDKQSPERYSRSHSHSVQKPPLPFARLIATGIFWTRRKKHSSETTLQGEGGGGGAEKRFQINVAGYPIIFGQDCRYGIADIANLGH